MKTQERFTNKKDDRKSVPLNLFTKEPVKYGDTSTKVN